MRPDVIERMTFCYPDSYFEPSHFATAEKFSLIELAERDRSSTDILDCYIEAHIHGIINIEEDVEAVVLDSSYKNTQFEILANKLPCTIEWHPGFRLPESRISDCVDYRGEEIAALACRLVNNGFITPYDIGLARRKNYDPQHLKMLWHCTAKFGSPIPE